MDPDFPAPKARRLPDLGLALKLIAAYWMIYFVLNTTRSLFIVFGGFGELLARRTIITLAGAGVTFLVYLVLRRVKRQSLGFKAVVAGLLAFPASFLFSSFNYLIFYVVAPVAGTMAPPQLANMSAFELTAALIVDPALNWYFLFAAWAAAYLAVDYQEQLRASDRRAALLAREAQEAQLRALRYQINPHFLFNTLNSLSSLVLSRKNDTAERMLMNLSNFFRSTLSADPTADVSLEEEIRLQRLYLDIEQIRFPDRLKVEIDVPADLLELRVPVLILQPTVENAVKYGVARSRKPVTIRIAAYEEAGHLNIKVRDDGTAGLPPNDAGTGVGLRNVADRLVARFGPRAGALHGPDPGGGYTVHIYMPAIRRD